MQDSDPTPQNTDEGKDQETTSFSQEQVNEIVSKRLAEANSKAEKRLKDEVSRALAEAERQSKLSEAEREKEFKAKQEAELNEREKAITLRERRADAKDALLERNIDAGLVDFVVDVDADKTNQNIDKLEKAFNKAIEAGIKAKLTGSSPEDFGNGAKESKPLKVSQNGLRSF